jgi:23S rRNA-/tRNA-specific pseudouridylate synthase
MCIAHKKGKESLTHWKLLADFGSVALLSVSPITGRTHQIRVHLPHIGLPLAIDPLYGNTRPLFLSDFKTDYRLAKDQTEKPLIERLTLHAYQIQFTEPEINCPDYFIAALDKKFTATIKMLTKHNPNGLDAFDNPDDYHRIISTQRLY